MQEIRHLVFNRQEIQEIAQGFLEERGERQSSGSVWELGGERDGIRLTLVANPSRPTPASASSVLNGGELLSAAILFCKRRRVPLPVRGQKQIEIMKGGLALVIAMRIGE